VILREAADTARRLGAGFPIVAITGPRQSGKSTLARTVFPAKPYVTLEDPDERALADADPRAFLARFGRGAVIDEAQRCPELFSYLQGVVDDRNRTGEFVLTGSQQFGLMSRITQSLAGRVGLVQLLPLSLSELNAAGLMPARVDQVLWRGGYPALHGGSLEPGDWLPNYVATYVERDVRQLLAVRDLTLFQRFVAMCAARSGQLLNLSSLAADCGITHVTAREWLTVLEASYLVRLLHPWHVNYGKRLVKTPKLYFLDTALAAWLLGVREAATLATHAMRGPLFETWVLGEIRKHEFNRGRRSELWFWRDNTGHEIDLLLPAGQKLQPVEIKSGTTFAADWLRAPQRWAALAGADALAPIIVYGGSASFEHAGCRIVGWRDLAHAKEFD
jgi:predicted AAA+ superfamily ATPase